MCVWGGGGVGGGGEDPAEAESNIKKEKSLCYFCMIEHRSSYALRLSCNHCASPCSYVCVCCCCCVVILRPWKTSKAMSGRSVNLTTLFLGRLRPPKRLTSTSCTTFACN